MDSTTTTCAACGVQFCVPTDLFKGFKETGQNFYCPNGHSLAFKPSENDKLRASIRQLTRERDMYKRLYQEKCQQLRATEGAIQAYRMNLGKARKRYKTLMDERNSILDERNELVVEGMRA